MLALHLCGEVRVYGFNQGGGHYYSKGFGTNRQVRHSRSIDAGNEVQDEYSRARYFYGAESRFCE